MTGYTFDYLGEQYLLNNKGLSISIDLLGQKVSRNVKNDLSQTITKVENRGAEQGGSRVGGGV
jgi:hypothetical protein